MYIKIVMAAVLFIVIGCSKEITPVSESTLTREDYSGVDLTELLEKEIPILMKQYRIPGTSIAIIHNGHLAWVKGFGYANKKKQIKVDENTIFQVASNSKSVNSWGILKLVEQGKLQLDQPVEDYLTRWHIPKSSFNSDKVTISRLLNHTSGLSLHGYPGYPSGKKIPSLEESLNGENSAKQKVELIYEPGTQFQYSGGGYTLLQLVVEEVTQQDYSDFMKNEILNPLGMKDSLFALHSEDVSNLATGYNQSGKAYPILSYRELAAAGLHTNVIDFTKFVTALVDDEVEKRPAGRNILSEDSLDKMFSPVKNQYGLGYGVISGLNNELITHAGANFGYQSAYYINRTSGDGLVILTNSDLGIKLVQSVTTLIHKWEIENQSDYRFGFDLVT